MRKGRLQKEQGFSLKTDCVEEDEKQMNGWMKEGKRKINQWDKRKKERKKERRMNRWKGKRKEWQKDEDKMEGWKKGRKKGRING